MNESKYPPPQETEPSRDVMRSPIRPSRPQQFVDPPPAEPVSQLSPSISEAPLPPEAPTDPVSALNTLRGKMELIADEFAQGKINRAQFNAMYKRYSEQRTIIERMVERNPNSSAWKQVMGTQGQTGFLRHQFEAQPLYFVVYKHNRYEPISTSGNAALDEPALQAALTRVWSMANRPKVGLGRRAIDENQWLILATGEYAATAVTFSLEPSFVQARLVRDLHSDFERANQAALARGWIVPDHMVFPQRALTDSGM